MRRGLALGAMLLSLGCGEERSSSLPEKPSPVPVTLSAWEPPEIPTSDEEVGRICRAVVSSIMGRAVETMIVDRSGGGEADVHYVRPDDQTTWRLRCRLDGDRVVWRTIDAFGPNSGLGRWRDGPDEGRITVAVNVDRIRVTEEFSDGSTSVNELQFE